MNSGILLGAKPWPVREIVYVHKDLIKFSNNRPNRMLIEQIKKDGLKIKYMAAFPAHIKPDGRWELTDGNHRVTAAIEMGLDWIPCVELTDEEYKYVRCSPRSLMITCRQADHPKFYSPGKVMTA